KIRHKCSTTQTETYLHVINTSTEPGKATGNIKTNRKESSGSEKRHDGKPVMQVIIQTFAQKLVFERKTVPTSRIRTSSIRANLDGILDFIEAIFRLTKRAGDHQENTVNSYCVGRSSCKNWDWFMFLTCNDEDRFAPNIKNLTVQDLQGWFLCWKNAHGLSIYVRMCLDDIFVPELSVGWMLMNVCYGPVHDIHALLFTMHLQSKCTDGYRSWREDIWNQ
ncbi:hypothetical protein CSKR_106253, partial [Clonorchis sinensis]